MKCVLTILGARGSVSVSGKQYSRYGGATTCALFEFDGQFVIFDAGTGILSLPERAMRQSRLPLFLTHSHADHLLGLPMCPYVMKNNTQLDVYSVTRDGMDAREQITRFMSPPLWPVGPEELPASIRFHDLPEKLSMGDIEISIMEGIHPGGVSVFRIEAAGRRVVFATDCSLTEPFASRLSEFARGCDLLLCDGQFSKTEWEQFPNFGHSSWDMAVRFAQRCGAKRLRIVHHSPFRTDAELDKTAESIRSIDTAFDFAKEGEEIEL